MLLPLARVVSARNGLVAAPSTSNAPRMWSTPFGFASEYRDAETGLIYLRARYYDPATAQFLTRDPALAATRAPYAYVAGNPLNARDPSGLWFGLDDLIASAGGALVGGALSAGTQFVSTGSVDWGQVGIDAASGAAFGETTLYAGPIAGGAAAGFVDSVGSQLYHNGGVNNFNPGDVALSTAGGAAFGGVLRYAGVRPSAQGVETLANSSWFGKSSCLFGRSGTGILNSNDYLRFGWGWRGTAQEGQDVLRLVIGNADKPIWMHFDLW